MEDKANNEVARQCDDNRYRDGFSRISGHNLTADQVQRSGSNPSGYSVDEPHSLPLVSRSDEHPHFINKDVIDNRNTADNRHTPDDGVSYNYSQDSDDPPATVSLSLSADDD